MIRAATTVLAVLLARGALADPAQDAAQAYTIEAVASPAAVKVGDAGKVGVVIRPKAPAWHVHPQAPLKVKLEAPAGLRLEKPELGRKDVADPSADAPRFESPFVATAVGPQEVRAHVDFFICSETACVKQNRTVATAVDVR